MSIKLMSAIFETEFRDLPYTKDGEEHKAKASTCKLLLLAIADHANDYGESAYPGYDRLEIKTALSRQGIADTLQALTQNGLLSISDKPSRLHTNNYTIVLSSLPTLKNVIIDESSHLTNASQATLLERVKPLDLNHQLTINKPSKDFSLSTQDLQEVNKKVDYILSQTKDTWQGRELLRDNLLPLADWYNKATNQVMTKRVQKTWYKALQDWNDEGLTPEHLQIAFEAQSKWRMVSDPNQLTKDACAIKAAGIRTDTTTPVQVDSFGIPETY